MSKWNTTKEKNHNFKTIVNWFKLLEKKNYLYKPIKYNGILLFMKLKVTNQFNSIVIILILLIILLII